MKKRQLSENGNKPTILQHQSLGCELTLMREQLLFMMHSEMTKVSQRQVLTYVKALDEFKSKMDDLFCESFPDVKQEGVYYGIPVKKLYAHRLGIPSEPPKKKK